MHALEIRPFIPNSFVFLAIYLFLSDKKAACFALGAFLQVKSRETLLQCDIMCCTGNNCNNQTFNLTQDAITVFTPEGTIITRMSFRGQ